ncbi:MAG: ribosome biogenesis GTPase Der [Candidatus Calescibacterium sp.]|nr:ribosome biogenesis GTPase Der [Candidatus Calescibacterium sp.]MCX7733177.1 ribosome biogenesis GTPase Der [bacterium]MDW8087832.1 ribosome biogenesis GTPase Der [Candidatus Calescibacterium sp.]
MLRVAIVGRVNVGKSTLFNALLGSSVSLVWKEAGTTRDVVEAIAHSKNRDYILMDTAGYVLEDHPLQKIMEKKSDEAIEKADIIIAVFDAKTGPTKIDWELRDKILKSKKPFIFVVNKVDNRNTEIQVYNLFANFAKDLILVSATTKKGIEQIFSKLDKIAEEIHKESEFYEDEKLKIAQDELYAEYEKLSKEISEGKISKLEREILEKRKKEIEDELKKQLASGEVPEEIEERKPKGVIRIAFVGRPNVGKSSLINAILGYQRCIVYHEPGTTRDAIRIPFEYKNYKFIIVDTPGVRKRSKIDNESVEFRSVGRSIVAMQVSDVVVLVIDSFEGITHQDKHLASFIERTGSSLVIALNKIDIIKELKPAGGVVKITKALESGFRFIDWAYFVPTSATRRYGIDKLLDAAIKSFQSWSKKLKPSELLKIRDRLVKLDFIKFQDPKIFQVGIQPPTFLIYVNDPKILRRYQVSHVEKIIRSMYDFKGSPIHFRIKKHGEEY